MAIVKRIRTWWNRIGWFEQLVFFIATYFLVTWLAFNIISLIFLVFGSGAPQP